MIAVTSHKVPVKSLSGAVTHPVSILCEVWSIVFVDSTGVLYSAIFQVHNYDDRS